GRRRGRGAATGVCAVKPGRAGRHPADGAAALPADPLVISVVALASSTRPAVATRQRGLGWVGAAGGALILGLGLRLVVHQGGIGDWSATVMATLMCIGAWLATMLLSTPRTAFVVTLGLVALFNVAAFEPRNPPAYDDR